MFAATKVMAQPVSKIILVSTQIQVNTGATIGQTQSSLGKIGDLCLVAALSVGSNATWNTPSGFTKDYDPASGVDAAFYHLVSAVNGFAGGGTVGTSTSNNKSCGTASFRNAVFGLAGSGVTRTGAGSLVLPAITMPSAGLLVGMVVSAGTSVIHTPPAGFGLMGDGPGAGYPKVSFFTQEVGAGATGTRSVTVGGTTPGNSAGILIGVLKA